MAGSSPVMLAALRSITPCLLAFFTAEMLGRNLVGLLADLEPVRSMVLAMTDSAALADLDSSCGASSPTLCSHCLAKSTGLDSRGRALSVEAVLSIVSVLASWAPVLVDASASLRFGLTAPGSSMAAFWYGLGIFLCAISRCSISLHAMQSVQQFGTEVSPGKIWPQVAKKHAKSKGAVNGCTAHS